MLYFFSATLNMPRKKLGTRKDSPVFHRPGIGLEEGMAPNDEKPPQPDPNPRKKTKFEQTLDRMDPEDLMNLLDESMAESLEPTDLVDPHIFKQLARKTRQWEQQFNVPDIPGYTASKEPYERKIKRFRQSLVRIIPDEATEDYARIPTSELQHDPDPGPSSNPTTMEIAVSQPDQTTDSGDFVGVGTWKFSWPSVNGLLAVVHSLSSADGHHNRRRA